MYGLAGHAVAQVGIVQRRRQPGRHLTLDHRFGDDAPHLARNLGQSVPGTDTGLLQRFVGADDSLPGVLVGER